MTEILDSNSCDFSVRHYEYVLESALKNNYDFCTFEEIEQAKNPSVVLRHDIDYEPLRALEFAEIESKNGIRAYYFFLVNSEIYNLRDRRVFEVVHALKKMGHYVGLHLDLSWDPNAVWEDVVDQCKREKVLFEQLTNVVPCEIISFHNPHTFTELVLNKDVEGMQHTYEKRFFSDCKYLSDSQGWYEGCVCKIFDGKRYPKIQLLTHPYIWPQNPKKDFTEDMAEMINGKRDELLNYLVTYHPVAKKNQVRLSSLLLR